MVLPFPRTDPPEPAPLPVPLVLLIGNPNVGKSLLFKNLTHRYVNVSTTVVQVADAKNLRRALLLTLQLAELGHPMILVLNVLDELAARGGRIHRARLSERLGVPVVGTIAARNEGTEDLAAAVARARPLHFAPEVRNNLAVFGLVPGCEIRVIQRYPSYVIRGGETVLALESGVAGDIVVRLREEAHGVVTACRDPREVQTS